MEEPSIGLTAAGIDPFDEKVYRAVLAGGERTPAGLAADLGTTGARVSRSLERLRKHGLVSRLSGRPYRYSPTEPEAALDALVRLRTAELERVRAESVRLAALFHAVQVRSGEAETVRIETGSRALAQWFVRLQHQAQHEMLVLDRPPYALAPTNPVEPVSLADGVAWRGIYAPESLLRPGALEEIRGLAAQGEQARVLDGLAIKLAIADRRIALLPLTLDLTTGPVAVVHESTLLQALLDLFDAYWERAIPIDTAIGTSPEAGDGPLIALLAAGFKDDAVARQLGISTRTMRRRIRELQDSLGVRNRFQAGVQAARRGLV